MIIAFSAECGYLILCAFEENCDSPVLYPCIDGTMKHRLDILGLRVGCEVIVIILLLKEKIPDSPTDKV